MKDSDNNVDSRNSADYFSFEAMRKMSNNQRADELLKLIEQSRLAGFPISPVKMSILLTVSSSESPDFNRELVDKMIAANLTSGNFLLDLVERAGKSKSETALRKVQPYIFNDMDSIREFLLLDLPASVLNDTVETVYDNTKASPESFNMIMGYLSDGEHFKKVINNPKLTNENKDKMTQLFLMWIYHDG